MTSSPSTTRSRFGRATRLMLVFTMLVGGLVAVSASPAAAVTQPDQDACTYTSGLNNWISRYEAYCRAAYWYNIRYNSDMTYSSGATHYDINSSRRYRRDCSGYVDMAWHLAGDQSTSQLNSPSLTVQLGGWKDLQMGDILDSPGEHAIFFVAWLDAGKTQFEYLTYGSTPVTLKWTTLTGGGDALDGTPNKANSAGQIDSHPYGHYTPYKYRYIN